MTVFTRLKAPDTNACPGCRARVMPSTIGALVPGVLPNRARRHAPEAGRDIRNIAAAHIRSEDRARCLRLFLRRQDRLAVLRLESRGNACDRVVLAALTDRLVEQTSGRRRRELVADTRPTRRFAEDGDVVRIASKRADVAPHPAHCRLLVLEPIVAGMGSKRFVRQETKDAEAVVRRYVDDVASGGQWCPVVDRALTAYEPSTMDP